VGSRRPPGPGRTAQLIDPPRQAAYDVVRAVDVDDAYANLVLPRLLRERDLGGRDAAFATELGYGTLRWQGVLDSVIEACAQRPVTALDNEVRAVLRTGCYQLLHMRVPAHAAVHASAQLARAVAGERPVGFVNAVLRAVSGTTWPQWVDRLAPPDPVGRLAFRHGYPRWVAQAWRDALGDDAGELEAALSVDRPDVHLLARPGRVQRNELLAQAGEGATAGPWSPYAVRLGAGDPAALPLVAEGAARVQDEGSQLVALVAARIPVDGTQRRWLDGCAGPGGKSALLSDLRPPGAVLLAADATAHRARLAAQALDGEGDVVVADTTRPPWREHSFDRVLVDVPCTGLGALRRRAEVRWRRRAEDVDRLHPLQVALLLSAFRSARPGGAVVYATCSPHLDETRRVVAEATSAHDGAAPVDVRPLLPSMPALGPGPDVQLWPHRHGTDAMYVAAFRMS
jgi:16S rRNA (cytosine967-C5)-methyltransferase